MPVDPVIVPGDHLYIPSPMSGPEEEEEVQDLQPGLVFGNSGLRPLRPLPQSEGAEPQEEHECCPTEELSLSRTMLEHVPETILRNSSLKYLYLEGNQICSIPDSLFVSLPSLQWLDLRNNLIVRLPAEIGLHRKLETLLLEGNPITELPPELGNVTTLKGLILRNCPITFPPEDIVHQGVQGILPYLRTILAQQEASMSEGPPELPVVEKLQLSELPESSVEEQGEEDELQRFKELRDKMTQLERAERNSKSHFHPTVKGKKATTKATMIPKLLELDAQTWKRQAAMKEMMDKQAILEQKLKSKEALQKWRLSNKKVQALMLQRTGRQTKPKEVAVFEEDSGEIPPRETSTMTITDFGYMGTLGDQSSRELERQIRARIEKLQERQNNPRGPASEQMAAAEQELVELTKIQNQLRMEWSRNHGRGDSGQVDNWTGD